jgi:hypothetical protein
LIGKKKLSGKKDCKQPLIGKQNPYYQPWISNVWIALANSNKNTRAEAENNGYCRAFCPRGVFCE